MSHPHLCPVCREPYDCKGVRCAPFNGVPHLRCNPKNRVAKWTVEVTPHVPFEAASTLTDDVHLQWTIEQVVNPNVITLLLSRQEASILWGLLDRVQVDQRQGGVVEVVIDADHRGPLRWMRDRLARVAHESIERRRSS